MLAAAAAQRAKRAAQDLDDVFGDFEDVLAAAPRQRRVKTEHVEKDMEEEEEEEEEEKEEEVEPPPEEVEDKEMEEEDELLPQTVEEEVEEEEENALVPAGEDSCAKPLLHEAFPLPRHPFPPRNADSECAL